MTPIEFLTIHYGVRHADLDAAIAEARAAEREVFQQECRDAECVNVENAPVGHVSKEYLEGWNEACRWIRAQIYARSQVTP